MANWLTQFKGTHGGLGLQPYNRARAAGYSAAQIAAAFPGSGLPAMGWRAQAALGSELQQTSQRAASASAASSAADSYRRQLDDYSARFSDLTSKYEGAMAKQSELQSSVSEWEGKWNKSQADYEKARSEADAYREEAVDNQLDRIRTGATAQGQAAAPSSGVTSGAGAAVTFSKDDDGVNVERNIQAEDSVLSRKGPVVEVMRRAGAGTPTRNTSLTGASTRGTGSGNYYASRFS